MREKTISMRFRYTYTFTSHQLNVFLGHLEFCCFIDSSIGIFIDVVFLPYFCFQSYWYSCEASQRSFERFEKLAESVNKHDVVKLAYVDCDGDKEFCLSHGAERKLPIQIDTVVATFFIFFLLFFPEAPIILLFFFLIFNRFYRYFVQKGWGPSSIHWS